MDGPRKFYYRDSAPLDLTVIFKEIRGKGTLYAVRALEHFITKVMYLDISNCTHFEFLLIPVSFYSMVRVHL